MKRSYEVTRRCCGDATPSTQDALRLVEHPPKACESFKVERWAGELKDWQDIEELNQTYENVKEQAARLTRRGFDSLQYFQSLSSSQSAGPQ